MDSNYPYRNSTDNYSNLGEANGSQLSKTAGYNDKCGLLAPPLPPPWMMTQEQIMFVMQQSNNAHDGSEIQKKQWTDWKNPWDNWQAGGANAWGVDQVGPSNVVGPAPPWQEMTLDNGNNPFAICQSKFEIDGAVLIPPNPNAPRPAAREKPNGCRTIFVGGVPTKCTQSMLNELFERCGEIQSIRMSQKNFAHVRFVNREIVDKALAFSGYRMHVDDRSDREYSGKLHVDYANARDDAIENIMLQRHNKRSSSPPSIVTFSKNEAKKLLEKLKTETSLEDASRTLKMWLDRGDCDNKNATVFYNLLAGLFCHVRRMSIEKNACDDILELAKQSHTNKMQHIMAQFSKIESALSAARRQKNWDQFSKAQRKTVDMWMKQTQDQREVHENDMLKDRKEDMMDLSDEETDIPDKKTRIEGPQNSDANQVTFELQQAKGLIERQKEQIEILQTGLNSKEEELQLVKIELEKVKNDPVNLLPEPRELEKVNDMHTDMIGLLSPLLQLYSTGATFDVIKGFFADLRPEYSQHDLLQCMKIYCRIFSLGIDSKWHYVAKSQMR